MVGVLAVTVQDSRLGRMSVTLLVVLGHLRDDVGMEVEVDGIAAAARLRLALEALRRRQRVFALDQQAVRRQSNAARMADAEPRGIALMRCPEREPLVGFLVERGLHIGGAGKLGIQRRLAAVGAGEDRRGGLLEGQASNGPASSGRTSANRRGPGSAPRN